MHNSLQLNLRKRWPFLVLGGTLVVGVTYGSLRLEALVRSQLPGFLKDRLVAAVGRPVEYGALHVGLTGVWVENLRVPRLPNEPADPLIAKRLAVNPDWWHLITTGKVRITDVAVQSARIRVPETAAGQSAQPWTAHLVNLSRSGVERFRLRDASVQVLAAHSSRPAYAAEKVDTDLAVFPGRFAYHVNADRFEGGGLTLASLQATGTGNPEGIQVQTSNAVYQCGTLRAAGSLQADGNAAQLQLKVSNLPLSRLAAKIGIPAEWAMKGRVTGTVNVGARDNTLREVKGIVTVDRGSLTRDGGRFPWKHASAEIDWTPTGATFRALKVAGDQLSLDAEGKVTTAEGQPFTAGDFQVSGRVSAEKTEAVAKVAQALSFQKVLEGRWSAGSASLNFNARGKVADLDHAAAKGHLQVNGLRLRPVAEREALTVDRLEADLEKTASRVSVQNLVAQTEGLTLTGSLDQQDELPTRPGSFAAAGKVEVRDLKALRRIAPDAGLWEWIPVVSPGAGGTVSFRVAGDPAQPQQVRSSGDFALHNFRFSSSTPLPNSAVFFIPVQSASGRFRQEGRKLEVTGLEVQAQTFQAEGGSTVDFAAPEPTMTTTLHLTTDDWRGLPAMPADAFPELRGGRFEADLKTSGPYSQLAKAPVDGSFRLTDASYTPGRPDATPIPVKEFAAEFHWGDNVLQLPRLTVDTPILAGQAAGKIYPAGKKYRVAVDLNAHTEDAGLLGARFTPHLPMTGGTAKAALHLDGPVDELLTSDLSGTVEIAEVQVQRPVPELGLDAPKVESARLRFSRAGDRVEVQEAEVALPGTRLSLNGTSQAGALAATVAVKTDRWVAPAALSVSDGTLALNGKLTGDLHRLDSLAFDGNLSLDDAILRFEQPGVSVLGGAVRLQGAVRGNPARPETLTLDGAVSLANAQARLRDEKLGSVQGVLQLSLQGSGLLQDPRAWVRSGELRLEKGRITAASRPAQDLHSLAAQFVREGEGVRWSDATVVTDALRLQSAGTWSPAGYELDLSADVRQLASLGLALPKGIAAEGARTKAHLSGNAEGVRSVAGTAEVRNLQASLEGFPAQLFPEVSARYQYTGGQVQIEALNTANAAVTLRGKGTWSAEAHRLELTANSQQLGKLGVTLPEGFAVQSVKLDAVLSGTAAQPVSQASGTVVATGLKFPAGPSGPHALSNAGARFNLDGKTVHLAEITASGPAGQFTGSGTVSGTAYQLSLTSPGLDPALARWLVPGTITGGALSGTIKIAGNGKTPVASLAGTFNLANAVYAAPTELGLVGPAAPVRRFAGTYRWEGERVALTDVAIEGDLLQAHGSLAWTDGKGRVKAEIKTGDTGRVADYFPMLAGKLQGGTGTGQLDLTFTERGAEGGLDLLNQGGVLSLPEVPAEYAQHPVETASVQVSFQPGEMSLRNVKLRGPKGNLDGDGAWMENGAVTGQGKAWFTRSYTSKLLKPTGVGWLVKLLGVREIKSDFKLSGTANRVMLDAGITRSTLWKFAKGRLPRQFQEVAKGKAPLWEAEVAVAAQPVAPVATP